MAQVNTGTEATRRILNNTATWSWSEIRNKPDFNLNILILSWLSSQFSIHVSVLLERKLMFTRQ